MNTEYATSSRARDVLAILGIALNMLASPAAMAEKKTVITESQAFAIFFERNLGLIASRYNIDSGEAERLLASTLPNPKVGFEFYELNPAMNDSGQDPSRRWPLGASPAWSVRIEQLVITAGKRRLRTEAAEAGTQALQYDLEDDIRVLGNALRHALNGLHLAQKNADLAGDNVSRYQHILDINRARLQTGDIAATDFARIEVESLKAEADADQMRSALIQARSELLLLLGWPESYATQSLYVEDAWPAATMTTSSGTRSPDAQIRSALENRPDLQAARIRVSQAEHNAELARRLIIPDITLVGYFLRDPGNFYTNTGGIGFNMELPLFNQFNGNIAKAGVELNQARLYIRQNEQAIHADVTRAEANWQSALSITQRFENSVLSRIEQLRQAEEYAYQRGRASLLQLIDAERNYKAMMMDYHVAQANRSNAWADLQAAVGASLEKITIDKEMGSDTRKIAERNHR